ncbi:MAG: cyclic nucleotide-binding domain-containing protein [Alphaproteobacteria bacterium]|nr:cyclic nucleotide-binding domain-containing protein [Alphaproteobacteria bacterium]
MDTLTRSFFPQRRFFANETIFEEGDSAAQAYLVDLGLVEISKQRGSRRVVLGRVKPGGIFGEMALVDDAPRMARAIAVADTVCFVIEREKIRAKIEAADPLMQALLRIFVRNIRSLASER